MAREISKIVDWVEHPLFSDAPIDVYIYGLVFVVILSMAWAMVVRMLSSAISESEAL